MLIRPYRKLPPKTALDGEMKALLALEHDRQGRETLLLWEAKDHCVVLPRSSAAHDALQAASRSEIPVVRRESGGGAVLVGPGCLNYALVLSLERRPALLDVDLSYAEILGAVAADLPGVRAVGSDLVYRDRKVGGHAQRRTRSALLHHGTLLYDFDLQRISHVLREPTRQPAYRRGRTHKNFLMNAPISLPSLLSAFEAAAMKLEDQCMRRESSRLSWPQEKESRPMA